MSFTGAGDTGHNLEVILRDPAGHAVLQIHVGYVHQYLCPKGSCLLDVSPGLKGETSRLTSAGFCLSYSLMNSQCLAHSRHSNIC